MADKKVTKRERREEAKQRRMEELRRRQRKARMRKFYYAGVAALVIAGIVLAVILGGGGDKKNEEELNRLAVAAGCTRLQNPADEGNSHQPPYNYRTNPPTSGNHSGSTSFTGVLPNPLPPTLRDENLVHNMEHGQVIIWYKPDVTGAVLDQLKAIVRKDATRLIIVPRASMEPQVAFTAWAKLMGCPAADAGIVPVAQKFADTFKGKGPEGDGDTPGREFTG